MKKCPYCAERIRSKAVVCKYCHSSLIPNPEFKLEINIKPKELVRESGQNEKATSEQKYNQMYEEMRRHRDYELSTAKWYISIFLAINGGLITLITSNHSIWLFSSFFWCKLIFIKFFLGFVFGALTWSGIVIIDHSHGRYQFLRQITNNHEPWPNQKEFDERFRRKDNNISPHTLLQIAILLLGALSILLLTFF